MTVSDYIALKAGIIERGFAGEIEWAENLPPCEDALSFWIEYAWVIVNSGMKNQIARKIFDRILDAYKEQRKAIDVFGHKGKAGAIDEAWKCKYERFSEYLNASDKLTYLQSLPWIGKITKYHLAKNLGMDCCKPDRHLVRIANKGNETPESLCKRLSEETGDRVATVDLVIWRAANLRMI